VARGGQGSNVTQYSNPRVDELLKQGRSTFDQEERRKIYSQVQRIIREELPFLPVFSYSNILGRKSNLEGFKFNPNTRTASWNVASWSWKA